MGLRPDPDQLDALTDDQKAVVEGFRGKFGDAVLDAISFRGQLSIWIRRDVLLDALRFARDDRNLLCDLLTDVTSVDYLNHRGPDEPRFELIHNLYSIAFNRRILLKTPVRENETVPSAVPVWKSADFMEREVYDLMGLVFEGHPNLQRILTPDGWLGHPLRKDHPTRTDQFPNVEN
ncbi:MAG TPA: NADH-quinone oxidoreductase subunit C [Candidatus Eisenbacteria bacterium]|nr:NADH-quinone oxidoreductase subunit C [Candidatus Eisenbacteria bacterium]